VAQDEPHVSVGGLLGKSQAYFEKEVYFGRRPIFGERSVLGKTYFWKGRPNFGARTTGGKKETCRKRRKRNMQEEKKHGAQEDKPNHDRVRVFDKIVMAISHKIV
jgi:hypothetical protein